MLCLQGSNKTLNSIGIVHIEQNNYSCDILSGTVLAKVKSTSTFSSRAKLKGN